MFVVAPWRCGTQNRRLGVPMRFQSPKTTSGVLTAVSAILASAAACPARAADNDTPAAEAGGLEEIVVSARRREESIQSTPVSVSAVAVAGPGSKTGGNLGDLPGSGAHLLVTNKKSGPAAANPSLRGLTLAGTRTY